MLYYGAHLSEGVGTLGQKWVDQATSADAPDSPPVIGIVEDPVPEWLRGDDVEREYFVELGILDAPLPGALKSIADYDAIASRWLRAKARVRKDIQARLDALSAELAFIHRQYEPEMARLGKREKYIDDVLSLISRAAPIPGGKKSRTVGFGVYGMRKVQRTVQVQDHEAVVEWAKAHLPLALRVPVELSYSYVANDPVLSQQLVTKDGRDRKLTLRTTELAAYIASTGEDIEGLTFVPEHDEPWFKTAEEGK